MAMTAAEKEARRYHRIKTVLFLILAANLAVSLGKGIVGWSSGSIGMVADAFHSLMDGSSNVIGLIGISLAARPSDETHAYGHAKFETFASIGIVILLLVTAIEIGQSVYGRLTSAAPSLPEASVLAFVTMGITIVINVIVTLYERRAGRRLKSQFLVADARHTVSDIYVSFSVVVSLIAVRLGYPLVDAVAGGAIALVIAYAAFKIAHEASFVLLDKIVIDPAEVERICLQEKEIQGCHKIRTRGSDIRSWIDLHLIVDPEMPTKESHRIASKVERRLKDAFGEETDVTIHIEPGRKT